MHFLVGEIRVAALRRHHARLALEALDRVLHEGLLALRDPRLPRRFIANFRRAGEAWFVTRLAHLREHLLPGHAARRRGRFGDHDRSDRLDPLEDALFGFVGVPHAAREQLRQDRDDRDRHEERQYYDDDELLRGLDRGGMRVMFRHDESEKTSVR